MDPLAPKIDIPQPDIGKEAPAEHDVASKAEESSAVSTSEPGTSYAIDVIPASIDHSILAETGSPDDENAVNQTETVALQSELEPSATEAEYTVEEKTDDSEGKTSDSAPILAAAQELPGVPSQEIIQPQPTAVLITEDDQDDKENQVEIATTSTNLEGHGTAENIEAKDYVVKEVDLTCFS
jgi:hypothetical protein